MVIDMDENAKKYESGGRRRAWAIGGVFAALLAAMMFFSGTIYQYNLPRITAGSPGNGYLNKRETSSGYADWETIDKVYSSVAGKISEVLVNEGDYVTSGQLLFRMSFERDEAERRLREIDNSREKLEFDIAGILLRMERNRRNLSEYRASQSDARRQYEKAATTTTTSNELALVDINIRKAEQTLSDTQYLYEAGATTLREVISAQDSLETLYLQRETTLKSIEDQKVKDVDTLETLQRNISAYDKNIADCNADMEQLEIDLASREHDRKGYDLQSEPYLATLAVYDANPAVYSPADGIVLTVPVENGQNIGENALMATIGVGISYIVECSISIDNNFIFPGDSVELSNTAHVLYGDIISIAPGERGKDIKILVISEEITVGETFDLTFSRRSDVRYTMVPNGALHQDSDGYYLNQVKKREGLLGSEYYLDRLNVFIGDSDSQNTVITGGIRFFEPIMLTSDKPVQPGDTITLVNEADFFAD